MTNTTIIAWLLGPLYVAVGIGFFLNRDTYARIIRQMLENEALIYVSGALALVAGTAIVLAHNLWVTDWPVIITLSGWAAIAKGASRILWPRASGAWALRIVDKPAFMTAVATLSLGLGILFITMAMTA